MAPVESDSSGGAPPAGAPADRAPRLRAAEVGVVRHARLLPGGDADILNISNTGMLVENKSRLGIGSPVNIRIEGQSVLGIEGHVVRSRVAAIHRDGSLSYETAIEFERPHSIDGSEVDESAAPKRRRVSAESEASGEEVYVLDTGNDW